MGCGRESGFKERKYDAKRKEKTGVGVATPEDGVRRWWGLGW
jgi:hypothetical protein